MECSSKRTVECQPRIPDSLLADDSKKWKEKVPIGIKFKPTDEVLAGYYLAGKVSGHTDGPIFQLIKEVDFYQCHPSQLSSLTYDFGEEKMYFFTRLLERENIKNKHVTGGGYWKKNEKISRVIGKDGKPIAAKTTLVYYDSKIKNSTPLETQWRMQEYMLLDNEISEQNDEDSKKLGVWTLYVAYYRSPKQLCGKNNLSSDLCKSLNSLASDNKRNSDHSVKRKREKSCS